MKMKNNILETITMWLNVIACVLWAFFAMDLPKPFNYLLPVFWTCIAVFWIYWYWLWKKRRKLTQ